MEDNLKRHATKDTRQSTGDKKEKTVMRHGRRQLCSSGGVPSSELPLAAVVEDEKERGARGFAATASTMFIIRSVCAGVNESIIRLQIRLKHVLKNVFM